MIGHTIRNNTSEQNIVFKTHPITHIVCIFYYVYPAQIKILLNSLFYFSEINILKQISYCQPTKQNAYLYRC